MATYVLVHGVWHGGWCWKKVMPRLRSAGHEVYAPTLTGLGERVHLLSPAVGLETHIQDVLGVLHYEDLRQVVLVGHSYGGMVITGVADRAAERVAQLVFLDAFVPEDGQSVLALMPPDIATTVREVATARGDGWRVPPLPPEALGITDAGDRQWVGPKLGDQPRLSYEQPLRCTAAAGPAVPRTYIHCTGFAHTPYGPTAERIRTNPGWRYLELDTGHDAMITAPQQLADLLLAGS